MNDALDIAWAIALGVGIGVIGSLALEFIPCAVARWHLARFGRPPGLIAGPLVLVVLYAAIFAVFMFAFGRLLGAAAFPPYLIAYLGASLATRTLLRRARAQSASAA